MSITQDHRRADKLALLVGSNPLPNYIAATLLQPSEVVLLYSPVTKEPYKRLRAAFELKNIHVKEKCIEDATDARLIGDRCRGLDVDHLHYSGGTKTMAVHARKTCKLEDQQASYLDERRGLLRFDDHHDESLDQRELRLSINVLLQLHGIERQCPKKQEIYKDHDLIQIAEQTLQRLPIQPPVADGHWLEQWTAMQIRKCLPKEAEPDATDAAKSVLLPEVSVYGERTKRRRPFEIDVALTKGHRVFVVSCTTSNDSKKWKPKLFEIAMRARQLGGDLARSAFVYSGIDDKRGPTVEELQADIEAVWDAPNTPRVFGPADLCEWAGIGTPLNLETLHEWLNS